MNNQTIATNKTQLTIQIRKLEKLETTAPHAKGNS